MIKKKFFLIVLNTMIAIHTPGAWGIDSHVEPNTVKTRFSLSK